mgnify:CR=1 FL=1
MATQKPGAAEQSAAPAAVEDKAAVETEEQKPAEQVAQSEASAPDKGAPADGVIPPDDVPEGATPGVDVGALDADTGFADNDPDAVVSVIVAVAIGGTRNGEAWPAVGEPITLPVAEAADYLLFGYVRQLEPTE